MGLLVGPWGLLEGIEGTCDGFTIGREEGLLEGIEGTFDGLTLGREEGFVGLTEGIIIGCVLGPISTHCPQEDVALYTRVPVMLL